MLIGGTEVLEREIRSHPFDRSLSLICNNNNITCINNKITIDNNNYNIVIDDNTRTRMFMLICLWVLVMSLIVGTLANVFMTLT